MASLYDLLCHHSLTCSNLLPKNCSPISLLKFFHTSSIILPMKTPISNQFIQLIHLFLHFVPTIQPFFLKYFYIFLFLACNSKFLLQRRGQDSKNRRGLKGPTRSAKKPKGSIVPQDRRSWPATSAAPAFPQATRRGTAGATPGDWSLLRGYTLQCKPSTEKRGLPQRRVHLLNSHCAPIVRRRKVFRLREISGSSIQKSGVPLKSLAYTAHCSKLTISSSVKNPMKDSAYPTGDTGGGDSATEEGVLGDTEGDGDCEDSAAGTTWILRGILFGLGLVSATTSSSSKR